MSTTTLDYLPFDYVTYTQRLLPALYSATEGDEAPLRALLQSLHSISLGPRSLVPLPLSSEVAEYLLEERSFSGLLCLEGLLDVATLRRVRAGGTLDPWEHLAKVIPTLKGRSLNALGNYGKMLHFHLFYTLCTEPPPDAPWTRGGPLLPHEEPMRDWQGYIHRDEENSNLWGMFEQTAPEALAQYIQPPDVHLHRASRFLSFDTLCRETIIGFLTPDEIPHLLEHVRTQERPWLASIVNGCMRDVTALGWEVDPQLPLSDRSLFTDQEHDARSWSEKLTAWAYRGGKGHSADCQMLIDYWMQVHPAEMREIQERYYQNLWKVEAQVLQRMHLAAARGWGMLQTSYS